MGKGVQGKPYLFQRIGLPLQNTLLTKTLAILRKVLYNEFMAKQKQTEELRNHPNVKGQIPPHSEEAEKSVLCCMMIDENVPIELTRMLKAEDFYFQSHRKIYAAMLKVWNDNRPVDFVTVTQALNDAGELENVGGAQYLTVLSGYLPTTANYKTHAEIVRKNARLRELMTAAHSVVEMCYAGEDALQTLQFAESAVNRVAESQGISALQPFSEAVNEAVADFDALMRDPLARRGLQTHFRGIDNLLGGLHGGDLVIIAARPGQGKTSIGMNIVQNVATAHLTANGAELQTAEPAVCAIFSLEMPASQLAKRMIASKAHVDFSKLAKGEISGTDEWQRIAAARAALCRSRIFVDDTSLTTPIDILSKCRRLKREQKRLDLVMVDYLTLMSSGKRVENRQQDVSEISRMMKLAAKELDVPILLLSQLSRAGEKEKRKPQMSDLRESGAIEQDADIIMFIYRSNTTENVPNADEAEIIVAKHRNGPLGTVKMRWVGEHVSFEDYDPDSVVENDNRNRKSESDEGNAESVESGKDGKSSGIGLKCLSQEEVKNLPFDD